MTRSHIRRTVAAAAVLAAALVSAACSGGDDTAGTSGTDAASSGGASAKVKAAAKKPAVPENPLVLKALVGSGCADYAKAVADDALSVTGMAKEPVNVVTGQSPMMTTLGAALSGKINPDVDLVDILAGGQRLTVFAPVDSAFAGLPAATMADLKTDADLMTDVLTYHVVNGQFTPKDAAGKRQTVQGAMLDITGSGAGLKVNGHSVVCGGIKTSNATVYLIDGVLIPPSRK